MATEESDDKTVPTLVDVIIPGKTTKKQQAQAQNTSPARTNAKHGSDVDRPPSTASLNAKLEALVAEILVRHMDNARREIIRRVLSEIELYSGDTNPQK